MTSRVPVVYALILFVLISSVPVVLAGINEGHWDNPRDLDPVIISDNNIIGLTGASINEIYVYAYNASENTWRPIPFQIDEKDNTVDYWLSNPNGIFDNNDELVFMAKDMGDQAPDGSYWIDDPISKDKERVEITVTDPVDSRQAWVYVYLTTTPLSLAPEWYMDYTADSNGAGADIVIAKSYLESHTSGGIPDSLVLFEGTGVNILDRQKVRISMKLWGWLDFKTNESLLEAFIDTVKAKVGPIRVIRKCLWNEII